MVNQVPQTIMSEAAEAESGLTIWFASEKEAKRYRMRCYATRRRAMERAAKIALQDGSLIADTGWEDLVFLIEHIVDRDRYTLWLGKPDESTFGILKIEKGKGAA